MKILSWDVGVKNLAYCLIDINDKTKKFNIVQWNVIDLMDSLQKCQHKHGDKSCDKIATCYVTSKDNTNILDSNKSSELYLCNTHVKKVSYKLKKIKITKNRMPEKCLKCKKKSTHCIDGKECYHWCDEHMEKEHEKIRKNIKTKKLQGTSANKQSPDELCERMIRKIDQEISENDILNVDEILIENQPTMINRIMKTVSTFLMCVLIARGKVDNNSSLSKVKFIAPSGKLKIDIKSEKKIKRAGESKVYKLTKKLGIEYCKALISDKEKKILEKYKKQDDMADAFLQGFRYYFNPLPKEYYEKIKNVDIEENTQDKKHIVKTGKNKKTINKISVRKSKRNSS